MNNDINSDVKEYIKNNNIFIDTGDSFDVWLSVGVNGITSFGKPNAIANIKKEKHIDSIQYGGEVMYEATYTFDSKGRRNTTNIKHKKTKKAIFFGDSILFGEGLNDNKTFPYYYQYFNPEYKPYNYGFPGHGPGQMLLQIQSDEFKKEFKDTEGEVFFVFRDDAIKNITGKVFWKNGYPKFKKVDNKLTHIGFFDDTPYDDIYLPSEFTDEDYSLTVDVFSEIKSELKKISSTLNFTVIILPLTFSNFKIHRLLNEANINVCNLFHVDTESYLGDATRFLDGAPTKFMNKFLNQRMYYYKTNNIDTEPIISFDEINTLDDVYKKIKTHSFLMSPMNDFPRDDAGVVIEMILNQYNGSVEVDYEELISLSEEFFNKKKKALYFLNENKNGELNELFKELDSFLYDMFKKEYIEFKKIYEPSEYIIDE